MRQKIEGLVVYIEEGNEGLIAKWWFLIGLSFNLWIDLFFLVFLLFFEFGPLD